MIAYHGSESRFKKFNKDRLQKIGSCGVGLYLSIHEEIAQSYGNNIYECIVPEKDYLFGDEPNKEYREWVNICKVIYEIDNTGFYNYLNDENPNKQIRAVAKSLARHELLLSSIFELMRYLFSDMPCIKQFFAPYVGVKMCNCSEILMWDTEDVIMIKRRLVKSS